MNDQTEKQELGRKKDAREKFIKAIIAIRDTLNIDPLVDTKYVRDFSNTAAVKQDKPYLIRQEFRDPDEEVLTSKLIQSFVDDTKDELPQGVALDEAKLDPNFVDPHWGHSTGYLSGNLTIDELDQLHPDLRVGLYKNPGSYSVFGRANYLFDKSDSLTIAINRMSLKLTTPFDVPNVYSNSGFSNQLDLLLSEGVPAGDNDQPDGQGFFFRDGRQLLMANEMKDGLLDVVRVFLDGNDTETFFHWRKVIFDHATDMLYRGRQTHLSWDQKWYFSAGPYALGDGLMKFALRPAAQKTGNQITIDDGAPQHHAARFEMIKAEAVEINFDLMLQIATEDAIRSPKPSDPPKCIMATEYTDLVWDNTLAPFRKVGTLSLKPSLEPASDPQLGWHKVGFNAWNTFHENRPVGQLFRARQHVHIAHRKARLEHSFKEVSSIACPFAGV